jgi:RimJ/RimL family protein N-acetyltransferase
VIRFRLVEPGDVTALTGWHSDPQAGGEFQWMGFRESAQYAAKVERGEMIDEDGGSLAVVDDAGVLLGDVSWRRISTNAGSLSFCWNIGCLLLPDHRGKGHGTEAQRELATYLFAHTTVERVEASTDLENLAEQRALEKAGFTREGVLRKFQWRNGEWRDMVVFSKLRGEP